MALFGIVGWTCVYRENGVAPDSRAFSAPENRSPWNVAVPRLCSATVLDWEEEL